MEELIQRQSSGEQEIWGKPLQLVMRELRARHFIGNKLGACIAETLEWYENFRKTKLRIQ